MLDLYKNIRLYRKQLHMTQEELAKKVGYGDRSSIAKIEAGKVDLPQSQIFKIADALNVTPSDLMGLDGIPVDYLVKSSDGATEYIIENTGKTRMDTENDERMERLLSYSRLLSENHLEKMANLSADTLKEVYDFIDFKADKDGV